MNEPIISGITAIQAILAPALGISATALLMLSIQNRYSLVINRIRLLNEERRRFNIKLTEKAELFYTEQIRFSSVQNQIEKIFHRCKELHNAILFMQFSIMLFVLSSLSIAMNLFVSSDFLRTLPVIFFSVGMIFVLIGIIYSALDVINSFKVAKIEVKGDE
jgi:hypothetical protein